MKLNHILTEIDAGDLYLRLKSDERDSQIKQHTAGFWILDKRTAKRLAGPFKSQDLAAAHKTNRPDKIPQDAVIRQFS